MTTPTPSLVFGVKIIVQNINVSDATHGLYINGANTEFRAIQNAVSGLTGWTAGLITKGGLKPYSRKIDLRKGGNVADPGTGGVDIRNGDLFWNVLQSNGIDFNGCQVQIYLFNGTTPAQQWVGTCEKPTGDAKIFSISFKGPQEQRISNILTRIAETPADVSTINGQLFSKKSSDITNQVVPGSFGQFVPSFNADGTVNKKSFAMLQRTLDGVDTLTYTNAYFTDSQDHPEIYTFPVVDSQLSVQGVQDWVAIQVNSGVSHFMTTNVSDTYLNIIDGTGKGQVRKILSFGQYAILPNAIKVFLQDWLETNPDVADPTTGVFANRSWVQITRVFREYSADVWPCAGFTDDAGQNLINSNPELWLPADSTILNVPIPTTGDSVDIPIPDNSKTFEKLSSYSFAAPTVDTKYNRIDLNSHFLSSDINSSDSFIIVPITSLQLATDPTLANWNDSETFWSTYKLNQEWPGIYLSDPTGGNPWNNMTLSSAVTTSYLLANDLDATTATQFKFQVSQANLREHPNNYFKVFYFGMPKPPPGFNFTSVSLGVNLTSYCTCKYQVGASGNASMRAMLRKWIYGVKNILSTTAQNSGNENSNPNVGVTWENLPDFYYKNDGPNQPYSQQFYQSQNIAGYLNGYKTFDLGIGSIDEYNQYTQGGLFLGRYLNPGDSATDYTSIYEMAMIFCVSSQDIKSKIFAPFMGRVFADTWQARKTSTALIQKPGEMLEHVERLQNWNDTCSVPILGWGLQYADTPLINTSTFDALVWPYSSPAFQLDSYDDGYTDQIKQSICRQFWFAEWTDKNGYVCAKQLSKTLTTSATYIQLKDITDRSQIKVTEPAPQDIYIEPYVQYDKNPDSGNFESVIGVSNTLMSTYTSSYVTGNIDEATKQALWNNCHALAANVRSVTKPPTDLTDLTMVGGQNSDEIAVSHLLSWTSWMRVREIEFPVHFNTGGGWQECDAICVNFPQQTNGVDINCLVEEVTVDPNPPYEVKVKAVMLV